MKINVNIITLLIILVSVYPVIHGFVTGLTRDRIHEIIVNTGSNVIAIFAIIFAVFAAKWLFSGGGKSLVDKISQHIPANIVERLNGYQTLIYLLLVPILFLIFYNLIKFFMSRISMFNNKSQENLADRIYIKIRKFSSFTKHTSAGILQIPHGLFNAFLITFILYLFTYTFNVPVVSSQISQSGLYKVICENTVTPLANSRIGKELPVLLADSFRLATMPSPDSSPIISPQELASRLTGGRLKIIERYNGVTLDEALKSNSVIDAKAREIVSGKNDSKNKAHAIYYWMIVIDLCCLETKKISLQYIYER